MPDFCVRWRGHRLDVFVLDGTILVLAGAWMLPGGEA
jgi:hypothetical protein